LRPMTPSIESPTDAEIAQMILGIRAALGSNSGIGEIETRLRNLLRGFRITTPVYAPGLALYRGVIVDSRPALVSRVGPPPPEFVQREQRCNRAGQPMFYGSGDVHTPLYELRHSAGDLLVLSEWQTTRELVTLHAGYAAAAFKALNADRPVPPDMEQPHGEALIQQFLAELFTLRVEDGDEHLYAASIAIAEVFLSPLKSNRYRSIDGIRYPSIAKRANGDNFALTIDFVRNGLEFVCAHLIRMNAPDDQGVSGMCIDSAVAAPEGGLRWLGACHFRLPEG
jgi:hypothetical protein